ncbi:MAG TPA: TonB-dependent receptor [Candidatus Polarisedimenticolia bacterium]|nr:TonB-dependent receptor [Candidatus Polarisedimenticolia bacterium]
MKHIPIERRGRAWTLPLLAMIVWGVLTQAPAAQSLPGDLTQLPIEELMAIDLVYGASRHQQKITEAPSFVTVVTAQDIRRYGYRTLADILRAAHGFYTTYDRNYTYLGVRGFSRPSDYNSRFLLLVDGHRINDNFYGSAYIGTESIIDVDLIDRVEIIRGPSSSLYGTSAFFAVINVITFAPQDTPRLQVSGLGASYGTPAGRMNVAKTFSTGASILASLSAYKSAGQTLFYPEYDDPQFNNGVSEGSDYDNAYQFFSTTSYKNLTVRLAYNSREKGIPTGAFDTPINDPDAKTIDSRGYLDLTYERPLSTNADLSARVSYDRSYYRGDYPYYSPYPTTLLYREHSWGEWFGAESKFTLRPTAKQTLTSGFEFRGNLEQRQRWQNVYPGPVDFDDQVHSSESGLYVQDEIAVSDRLALNLGVRHDHYETFGHSTNPRAAFILFPADQTTLKFLFGSAFRAPTVYELYYGSHANPDLRPESIATYEVVLEQYAHGNLRLSGSAFLYRISDLVSVDTSSGLFENLDHVSAQGIEIEIEKRFRSGFRLRGSSTLQEARDDVNDQPLTNSPRLLAKFSGEVPIRSERLTAGVEVQYTSRRLTLDGNYAPDFAVANLNVLSRQLVKGLDLSVGVYNLFDTTYADPGSEHHLQDTIEQDGRNFRIKLTWGF